MKSGQSDPLCMGSIERKKNQEMKESFCLLSEKVLQPEVYFYTLE